MSTATETRTAVATTRTGGFPIGFRRSWSARHKDLPGLIAWAKAEGFGCIDLGRDGDQLAPQVLDAGLGVGSVDLSVWKELISEDADRRATAIEANASYIAACAKHGIRNFFIVLMPQDPGLGLTRNHELAAEAYAALAPVFIEHDARLVIEGWPGPGALACTPDGYARFFTDCPQACFGVNYDPSHLVRMGIDPLRFLTEFGDRVYHVHGKDTAIDQEAVYRYGYHLGAADGGSHGFGGTYWRYTIPGHGVVDWSRVCAKLVELGYDGHISIELEDERFNGSEEGTDDGLRAARDFLRTA